MFKMRMSVRELGHSGDIVCTQDTTVIWGNKLDTLGFLINGKELYYYTYTSEAWEKLPPAKRQRVAFRYDAYRPRKGERAYLLQDRFNDLYHIRFITIDSGAILIFITNVRYGKPTYLLSSYSNVCF